MNDITDTYEDKMLRAFAGDDKCFYKYKKMFANFSVNGIDRFVLTWNWWSFLFSAIYSLYKKLFVFALLQFSITFVLCKVILPSRFCTGISYIINLAIVPVVINFFIYNRYKKIKAEIEKNVQDEQARIETMWRYK
ncbi:MAG: DUF2628 domain-containing protein [Rickettsiales bacterium]|jgi:membrane-anchored protein YejM (alkaline phosphatase superfamily)|nr:DUF2628 domain-containing protein [Rickettsiales bacterium]